jgi:hypothetical protein
VFACQAAIAMCGDTEEGMELACGPPREPGPERVRESFADEFFNVSISEGDLAEARCEEALRRARIDATPLAGMAKEYADRSVGWLRIQSEELSAHADVVVREALEIVSRDAFFIWAKLHRALDGRDRFRHDDGDGEDHPVQNDWNGSAKVALLSLERSDAAWRVLADATGDADALDLAGVAGMLHAIALDEFPDAVSFTRPGFDDDRIAKSDGH